MTLARTALRLISVAALTGATDARPTIAAERIYDSRVSDISPETFADDAKPVVIVLTDKDEGDAISDQNGGPPFRRAVDLMFEIGMVVRLKDGEDFDIGYPDTDARLEASLDVLEFQIVRRLSFDLASICAVFRSVARAWKFDSHRQVTDESGVKVACRILTLTCEVGDDDVRVYNAAGAIPTGIDVLPEPLRRVALALPAGSSGKAICDAIILALSPPLQAPAFGGIDLTVDAADTTAEGDDREIDATIDVAQVSIAGALDFADENNGGYLALLEDV
jgi:hypothetical protein